jgi:hypothetical protein
MELKVQSAGRKQVRPEAGAVGGLRTYCRAKVSVRNWDVLQLDHRTPLPALLGRSIWHPLHQGASLLVDDSQG